MHCMFPLDSSELFSSGITKKYLFNFHGQQLRRVVCRFSYLCVSVLSNYGCFVAQYELFDNGSHARQSCHLSRAVGPPPPPKKKKNGGTEANPFPSKVQGLLHATWPLGFSILPTALLRMGGPPPPRRRR